MSTVHDIELAAEDHRAARDRLERLLSDLEARTRTLQRERLPRIRAAVIEAKATRHALAQAIEEGREHFARPKIRVLHGIKCGYRKAPDAWQWPGDAKLVALIRKHCPGGQAETLVQTTERPVKKALKQLGEPLRRKLGILVAPGGDVLMIDPVEGDLERLLNALLGDVRAEVEADHG